VTANAEVLAVADVVMPLLGETVTEGTITRWLKEIGDEVVEGDSLYEVSTDKVDSEVPAVLSGTLIEIFVNEGETVEVGTLLAIIADVTMETRTPSTLPVPSSTDHESPVIESVSIDLSIDTDSRHQEFATGISSVDEPIQGSLTADTDATESTPPAETAPTHTFPPVRSIASSLSPVVRKLFTEHGIHPSSIVGSGIDGRITRADVLSYMANRSDLVKEPSRPISLSAARSGSPSSDRPLDSSPIPNLVTEAREGDLVIPFTNIRRRTAEHMLRSKHTSAHTMVSMEVDYYGVDLVRSAVKRSFLDVEGFSLTYLPFIMRAVLDGLAQFPNVNSSVTNDGIIVHRDFNIGIAVDLDFEGLIVPVIHQADQKRLRALAREIVSLAAMARAKKLTMDNLSAGTFTITNAGPYGTFLSVPVINQPQVAILSTDGVRKRPVVLTLPNGEDSIAVHPVGNLVMSWDHRAFDGAYAAAFMAAIRQTLESRSWTDEL
jgi:pyruvate dehydrogenase E2 component (dihydrolipoamide acetyltransferase)